VFSSEHQWRKLGRGEGRTGNGCAPGVKRDTGVEEAFRCGPECVLEEPERIKEKEEGKRVEK